jgi:hypothetical protein
MHFFSKYVFIYFPFPFLVITWSDGLVVKALECGQEGCQFKFYMGHVFGDSMTYTISTNMIY